MYKRQVLNGRVSELPLLSTLSVASKSFGLTYSILPRTFLRKFSNLERPMLLFRPNSIRYGLFSKDIDAKKTNRVIFWPEFLVAPFWN